MVDVYGINVGKYTAVPWIRDSRYECQVVQMMEAQHVEWRCTTHRTIGSMYDIFT